MKVAWWSCTNDLRNPGARLRAALIMRGLQGRGHDARWFDERPLEPDCLVLQKRYDDDALALVEQRRRQGLRTVLDLWDNHFLFKPGSAKQRAQAERLRVLATRVDGIVACSAELAGIVRRECPQSAPVRVIGDRIDDLSVVPSSVLGNCGAWFARHRARRRRNGDAGRVGLLWFGDRGGVAGRSRATVGMPDIAAMIPTLEALDAEFPLRLTVVSNSRALYRQLFAPARFPHAYETWHSRSFPTLLATHDIALIPTSDNEFTRCKSDNRVVSALDAGLAVVAGDVPSYRRYEPNILLGDVSQNLRRYLQQPALRAAHVEQGRALARHWAQPERIVEAWEKALAA